MALDIKVGDFWSHPDDRFRRIMDMVDTGIDQIVYWKDESKCTGRCSISEFEHWKKLRGARLTKRQSEKGFRLEHNERFKKCGNYALGNAGLPQMALSEQSPPLTTSMSGTETQQQAEAGPVQITHSGDGLSVAELPQTYAVHDYLQELNRRLDEYMDEQMRRIT